MKYVPFAILSIMGLYSHFTGIPFAAWVAGAGAACWAGILWHESSAQLDWQIRHYESALMASENNIRNLKLRLDNAEIQINEARNEASKALKAQDILAGQITDIDRRVQGNDPFGG